MTLAELLESSIINKKDVSIGTQNAFIYIGPSTNVKRMTDIFRFLRENIESYVSRYDDLKDRLSHINRRDYSRYPWYREFTNDRLEEVKNNIVSFLNTRRESYEKKVQFLSDYINPLYREVITYHYRDWDDSYVIIIPGEESANFWFKKECDKYYSRKVKKHED